MRRVSAVETGRDRTCMKVKKYRKRKDQETERTFSIAYIRPTFCQVPICSSRILGTLQIWVRGSWGRNPIQYLNFRSVYFDVCWRGAIGRIVRIGTADIHDLDDHARSAPLGPERNAYVLHAVARSFLTIHSSMQTPRTRIGTGVRKV